MSKKKLPLVGLTIHLVKKDVDPMHILKDQSKLKHHAVKDGRTNIGTLYVATTTDREPTWTSILKPHVSQFPKLLNRSQSAALLIETADRWFALTFGHGWALLANDVAEERFGLRVTLNSVAEKGIRAVNVTSMDAFANHKQTQSIQHGPMREFGIDYEQEVVRAISGRPDKASLGEFMIGKGPLSVRARTKLPSVPALLGRYVKQFESEAYKEKFDGIDQISELRDKQRIDELNQRVVDQLNAKNVDNLWLGPPEVIDWTAIAGFAFERAPTENIADPSMEDLITLFESKRKQIDFSFLKHHHLHAFDGNDNWVKQWSIFKSLHCELSDGEVTYILSNGTWFEVERSFQRRVNKAIDKLLSAKALPAGIADEAEGEYNKRVAKGCGYQCADAKSLMYGGGRSRIEFCDLYTPNHEMIHVKRGTSSSTLSHLFQQGWTSAQILQNDELFRKQVRGLLKDSFDDDFEKAIDTSAYEVVYAIVVAHAPNVKLSKKLPFFSRVVLKNAAQRLSNSGYKVSVCFVNVPKVAKQKP